MSKHTSGPWETETLGAQLRSVRISGKNARRIMPLGGPALAYLPEGREDIQEANARLIAAAPELLHSLKNLVEILIHPTPYDDKVSFIRDARAAIAKAEGGES